MFLPLKSHDFKISICRKTCVYVRTQKDEFLREISEHVPKPI